MTEKGQKFLEAVSQDRAFIEKLSKAETPEAVIALAAEKGFALTAEDLKPDQPSGELSENELDAVAGGAVCICPVVGAGSGTGLCACLAGGGGVDYKKDTRCVCIAYGHGQGD